MIRHADPTQPVGALALTMAEPPSLRLLVPTVGGVSLLAARLLSAGGSAVALSTVTEAADPNIQLRDRIAFGKRLQTWRVSENGSQRNITRIEDEMRVCGADDDISFSTLSRRKFIKLQIQMIDDMLATKEPSLTVQLATKMRQSGVRKKSLLP